MEIQEDRLSATRRDMFISGMFARRGRVGLHTPAWTDISTVKELEEMKLIASLSDLMILREITIHWLRFRV
jgi:hypothetical protein